MSAAFSKIVFDCVSQRVMSSHSHTNTSSPFCLGYGYGPLIKAYTHFLTQRAHFHQLHPVFSGNFDYEEYIAAKGVEDLDQG